MKKFIERLISEFRVSRKTNRIVSNEMHNSENPVHQPITRYLADNIYWGPKNNFSTFGRREKILSRINVTMDEGLEIGALSNPVVTKEESGQKIIYVDYASADRLREVYKNDTFVDIGKIVHTDLIWGEKDLPTLVQGHLFNYVIASHVIEHVPDMIGWLQEVSEVLADHGTLSLAIPDKRYTFDFARELSTPGMLIEAFFLARRRPSPQAIFDYMALSGPVDLQKAWDESITKDDIQFTNTLEAAYQSAYASFNNQVYQDAHVNIFTPSSFIEILEVLSKLSLTNLLVVDFYDTDYKNLEFFISLERIPRETNSNDMLPMQLEGIYAAKEKIINGVTSTFKQHNSKLDK